MAYQGVVINVGSAATQGKQVLIDGYFDGYSAQILAGTVKLAGGTTVTRVSPGLFTVQLPCKFKAHMGIQITLCETSASNRISKALNDTIVANGQFQVLVMNTTTGAAADIGPTDYVSFQVAGVNSQVVPLAASQVV